MVLEDPPAKGKNHQGERRLVAEFLAREYPTTPHVITPRLGILFPQEIGEAAEDPRVALLSRFKRYPDALILLPDKTIILEAMLVQKPGKISQLKLYRKLFVETPAYRDRWFLPIELMLLYAVEDPVTIQMAREEGIRSVQFSPPWIHEALSRLPSRMREPPLRAMLN